MQFRSKIKTPLTSVGISFIGQIRALPMCLLKWHLDAIRKSTYVPFGFSSSCFLKRHLGSHWSESSLGPTPVHAQTSFACFFADQDADRRE